MSQDSVLTRNHPSSFHGLRYVYPVLSRRAGGVSIGINLSPHCLCSFNCIYCQVTSRAPDRFASLHFPDAPAHAVDLAVLEQELRKTAGAVLDGSLFDMEPFSMVEPVHRHLKDFAFSGDGEPTMAPGFPDAVDLVVRLRGDLPLGDCKLVLITNATCLRRPELLDPLDRFHAANGEIWAKLDAGTEDDYRLVNRSTVPYRQILDNIVFAATRWGIVAQTMLLAWHGQIPAQEQIEAYCERLNDVKKAGGDINRVQLYTIARKPASDEVQSLSRNEMIRFAALVHDRTGLQTDPFFA